MIALDKRTGQERWRREIPEMVSRASDDLWGSWSTPIIARAGAQPVGRQSSDATGRFGSAQWQ